LTWSEHRVVLPPSRRESTADRNVAQLRPDVSTSTLRLNGELDIATAATVRTALESACRDVTGEVIVDLTHVSFFDGTAIDVFARAAEGLHETGGRLTLSGLSPFQEKVLRICALDHLLAVAVCRHSTRPPAARLPRG
jgi:anti-sigma B factor antagonist